MDTIRQNKVSRLIQRDLSALFQQECREYTEGAMVSVTTVRVSPDLSYAKIYLSIFPSERAGAVMGNLEEKNRSVRFLLGKKIGKQMRIIPELRFFLDDSLDYIDKIDGLLKEA
ncbi:MAG: 30S ribosome-binding factor RbfA [Culturomica sp.]|jgi:ribosome-binding factor A|nr:30S ribosome-binding factor RbfA [Culturomica sp.]